MKRSNRTASVARPRAAASPTSHSAARSTPRLRTSPVALYSTITGAEAPAWELVQRIAASRRFGRSTLLANFLLFVTHRSLTGRAAEINEQQIGVHVFGRQEQFNRGDDNIVRTYARMLRKRLEEYFRNEGCAEPLSVSIPRGSYVALFTQRTQPECGTADHPVPNTGDAAELLPSASVLLRPAQPAAASRFTPLCITLSLSVLLLATALTAVVALTHTAIAGWLRAQTPTGRVNHLLWAQMFEANRDTYIVPADGGLVMLESFLPTHVNLTDYANGTYRSPDTIRQGLRLLAGKQSALIAVPLPEADVPSLVHKIEVLAARRYTSVVDLVLSSQLAGLPEVVPQRLMIRYARDLRMDDLRTGNLVLLGSADSNPWVDIFQPQLNFHFTSGAAYGGSPIIVNRHPLAGERETYGSEEANNAHRSYGVIAYLPNLGMIDGTATSNGEGSGHILLVEGINMAGTQAAGAFLLSPEQMRPVLSRAMRLNGGLRSFEVLIDTSDIAANSARTHVLSERIIPD